MNNGKGSLLAKKRKEKGLNQIDIVRATKFSRHQIMGFEMGRQVPSILALKEIAPVIGCDYHELIDPSLYEALEGSPLARMRKRYGYTQKQLADKIGRSQKLVSAWEKETRVANADLLQEMAAVLECEVEDLI